MKSSGCSIKTFQGGHDLGEWTESGPQEKAVRVTAHPPLPFESVPSAPSFIQCSPRGPEAHETRCKTVSGY